jgi:Zn-finger nucleic acid-binding protein
MIIACTSCQTQYDVGDLAPGRQLRCACGTLNTVPTRVVRELPMQQCGTCGAPLKAGAKTCGYCSASVTLDARGWGESCPSCHARLVNGARFCSSCGLAIRPNPVRKSPTNQQCPRCSEPLVVCQLENGHFTECTGCGGVWLEESAFERLTDRQDRAGAVGTVFAAPERVEKALSATRVQDTHYLKCPVCSKFMNRTNFARVSGILIDRCKGHGYWFDAHELERVFAFIADGGMDKARSREVERQREQVRRVKEQAGRAQRIARQTRSESHQLPTPATQSGTPLLQALHYWLFS